MMRYLFLIVCIVTLLITTNLRSEDTVSGPYFGQTPPGTTPQKFVFPAIDGLPDFLDSRIAVSPDGNECFFSGYQTWSTPGAWMYYTQCIDNVWVFIEKLLPPISYGDDYFGIALSISATNRIVIGAGITNLNHSGMYVYRFDNSWVLEQSFFVTTPTGNEFYAVTINAAGDVIATGEGGYNSNDGRALITRRTGTTWILGNTREEEQSRIMAAY